MEKAVNRRKKTVIAILTVVAIPAVAVGGWYCAGTSHTFIPEDPVMITHQDETTDAPYDTLDRIPAMGFTYLANWAGGPYDKVEDVEKRLWLPPFYKVNYRADITTPADSRRYNIFSVESFLLDIPCPFDIGVPSIDIYADDLPPGITLSAAARGEMPGVVHKVGVAIDVGPEVPPGQYELQIGLVLAGRDYGTLTCNIEVTG